MLFISYIVTDLKNAINQHCRVHVQPKNIAPEHNNYKNVCNKNVNNKQRQHHIITRPSR